MKADKDNFCVLENINSRKVMHFIGADYIPGQPYIGLQNGRMFTDSRLPEGLELISAKEAENLLFTTPLNEATEKQLYFELSSRGYNVTVAKNFYFK